MRSKYWSILKQLVTLLLMMFLCISCGSPVSTDKQGLTIENNKTYPGGVIKAKIVSVENIKSISVGIAGTLKINKQKPEGNKWDGKAEIPALNPGKYEIAFVVTPFVAPSTTLTSEIEVVNKPTFDVQTSSVDGKKKITVKGEGIASVELLENGTNDSSKIQFTKTNNTFEYQGTPQPTSKIVITDSNGLKQEKSLSFETELVIFFGSYPNKDYGTNLSFQTENQTKSNNDEQLFPFEQEDDLMKSLLPNSVSTSKSPSAPKELFAQPPLVYGISPNRRFLFLSSQYALVMEKATIDSGRKLESIGLKYYYVYDRDTKTNHLIDKFYIKYYFPIPKEEGLLKEIGSYYYPVFWGQDELLVIQVKKGEGFVRGNEIEIYPQLKTANQDFMTQSMDATPKCMSISLKDFTMKESDKVKPITPWVCWADQYKGIISWMSPTEPRTSLLAILPNPEEGTLYPHYVSDLSGDHVWNIPLQSKTVLNKDEKYKDSTVISATYWNGKKAILLGVSTNKKYKICIMDMESGVVEIILDNIRYSNDFGFTYEMLYGSPSNQNSRPLAVFNVSPQSIDPYSSLPPYKMDVSGLYVTQITKDGIKLLWKVGVEPYGTRHQNPFFMTEVVK